MGKIAPTVSTQNAKFDHRSSNYPIPEFQKHHTTIKHFRKYTYRGALKLSTSGMRFRRA